MKFNLSLKILFTGITLLFLNLHQNLFAYSWQWATTAGGTSEERSYSTAIDPNGNVYSLGSFKTNPIVFGSFTLTNVMGSEDIFLVKYDPSGNVLWAKSFGGSGIDIGASICCDQNGNVYITGTFDGPNITIGLTLSNAGMKDIFLAKLDPTGTVIWSGRYGDNGDDLGTNIFADANSLYLAGHSSSPYIIFGPDTLYAVGNSKAFAAKFDLNGNAIWANGTGGGSFDQSKVITADNNGNVYLGGSYFDMTIIFDTDTVMNTGDDDIFIVKYDSQGNEVWAKCFGGFVTDKITGIVAMDNGDVYIAGHFYSQYIQFDSTVINNAGFPAWDMFITKLNSNSDVEWAKTADANTDEDVIVEMKKGGNGNLFITGWYSSSITLGNTILTSNGSTDIFTAELDTTGTFIWARSNGGTDQDFPYSISVDQNNDVVIGGFFKSPTVSFDAHTISFTNSVWDMFVAKLSVSTEIPEINTNDLKAYPNPSNGILNIDFPSKDIFDIKILNSTGEIVFSKVRNTENNFRINLNHLNTGIYFININTDKKSITEKLVRQ